MRGVIIRELGIQSSKENKRRAYCRSCRKIIINKIPRLYFIYPFRVGGSIVVRTKGYFCKDCSIVFLNRHIENIKEVIAHLNYLYTDKNVIRRLAIEEL